MARRMGYAAPTVARLREVTYLNLDWEIWQDCTTYLQVASLALAGSNHDSLVNRYHWPFWGREKNKKTLSKRRANARDEDQRALPSRDNLDTPEGPGWSNRATPAHVGTATEYIYVYI